MKRETPLDRLLAGCGIVLGVVLAKGLVLLCVLCVKNIDAILRPLVREVPRVARKPLEEVTPHMTPFADSVAGLSDEQERLLAELLKRTRQESHGEPMSRRQLKIALGRLTEIEKQGFERDSAIVITARDGWESATFEAENLILTNGETQTRLVGNKYLGRLKKRSYENSLAPSEALFSQEAKIGVSIPSDQQYKNVFGEVGSRKQLSQVEAASKGFRKLANSEPLSDGVSLWRLVEAHEPDRPLVLVGHSELKDGARHLVLPTGDTVPIEDIQDMALQQGIECIVVTCHSRSLQLGRQIDFAEALAACRVLEGISVESPMTKGRIVRQMRKAIAVHKMKTVSLRGAVGVTLSGGGYAVHRYSSERERK